MNPDLVGSWVSTQSTIPNYTVGEEWLRFAADGPHMWEVAQPGGKGRPSLNPFHLRPEGDSYRMMLLDQKTGVESLGYLIDIQFLSPDEITIKPELHGHTTHMQREKS